MSLSSSGQASVLGLGGSPMSMPERVDVTCRHCGEASAFTMWQSLNVQMNPEMKEKLLSLEVFRHTCAKCNKATLIRYPLLYHDMQQKLMVWCIAEQPPDLDFAALPGPLRDNPRDGYRCRWVKTVAQLLEKIRIADAGLDDRAVELFKHGLRGELAKQGLGQVDIVFAEIAREDDGAKIVFLYANGDERRGSSAPLEVFESFARDYAAAIDERFPLRGQWPVVDESLVEDSVAVHARPSLWRRIAGLVTRRG
jgi:hypothetical protein